MENAKKFVLFIIKGVVNNPNDVEIKATEDDRGILLSVGVNKEDMGIVIGRQGVNASAIKLVAKMYGYMRGLKVSVKIREPIQKDD